MSYLYLKSTTDEIKNIYLVYIKDLSRAQLVFLDSYQFKNINYENLIKQIENLYNTLNINVEIKQLELKLDEPLDIENHKNLITYLANYFKNEFSLKKTIGNRKRVINKTLDNIPTDIQTVIRFYSMNLFYHNEIIKQDANSITDNSNRSLSDFLPWYTRYIEKIDNKQITDDTTIKGIDENNTNECLDTDISIKTNDEYMYLANEWIELSSKEGNSLYSIQILFNVSTNMAIVVDENSIYKTITDILDDFMYITNYKMIGCELYNNIKQFFHLKEFIDHDELSKKIDSFNTMFDVSENTQESNNDKSTILGFINDNYIISKDPSKKILDNIIQDTIERELGIFSKDKLSFSRKISKYLLELGINKKRFYDGVYYYGMEPKTDIAIHANVIDQYEERMKLYNSS